MQSVRHLEPQHPPIPTAAFDQGFSPEIEIDGGAGGCVQFLVGVAASLALITASIAGIVVAVIAG